MGNPAGQPASIANSDPATPCPTCGSSIGWWDIYGGGPHCHHCRDWPAESLVSWIAVCVAGRWLTPREAQRVEAACPEAGDDEQVAFLATWELYEVGDWDVARRWGVRQDCPRDVLLEDWGI